MAFSEMTIDEKATAKITTLSQGLPHYAHLLAQLAGRSAVEGGRFRVELDDIDEAIRRAISRAQRSIAEAYHRATLSTRPNLYRQVLLACALASQDDLGYFAAADVRAPLTSIMGRPYDIPAFAPHLNALSEPARGPVLQKKGRERRFRYRFVNPLLQPFIIMRGLSEGLIDDSALRALPTGR